MPTQSNFGTNSRASQFIRKQSEALSTLAEQLDVEAFERSVDLLAASSGRVICTGMGKSGHVAKKIAATMASTGTPSLFLHPGEAAHGDLGMVVPGDSVLAFSKSGTTAELFPVLQRAMQIDAIFVLVSENDEDGLAFHATETIKLPRLPELWHKAPTVSTIMQMAVGDAIATELTERCGFGVGTFHELHPGGAIGANAAIRLE